MPDRIQKLTLAAPTFSPATVQMAEYNPQPIDMSLLATSLARREERRRSAIDKKAAMALSFAEMKSKLHQDKETLDWFNAFAKNYEDQVDAFAQLGDYGNALAAATRLGAEAAQNGELQARIASNVEYENWTANLNKLAESGSIDDVTRDRIIATNPYKFTPITQDDIVTGGKKWTESGGIGGGRVETPVQKVPITSLLIAADKLYKERVSKGGSTVFKDYSGNIVNYYDKGIAGYEASDYQTNWKNANVLRDIFNEVIKQDPNAGAYIEQMYKDAVWELQVKKNELNTTAQDDTAKRQVLNSRIAQLEQLVEYDNGGYISLPEFLQRMTSNTINNGLAYRNILSNKTASPLSKSTRTGSGSGNENGDESQDEAHIRVTSQGGTGEFNITKTNNIPYSTKDSYRFLETY